jgi:hypothetical protein
MSMAYLAQPDQQQQLEWLDGGTLAILLDGKATNGRFAGRDKSTPRPDGFEIPTVRLAEASEKFGNVIVGPPR